MIHRTASTNVFGCLSVSVALAMLVACATNADGDAVDTDGGDVTPDGSRSPEVAADGGEDGAVDLDAERPLACGDAGFCETRLPPARDGTPPVLRAVQALAPNDVWSVTEDGAILHYDGARWAVAHRLAHSLLALWVTSTSVWVGGEGGLVARRRSDGTWHYLETGHLAAITGIAGASDDDVWLTSSSGSVDHFDGTTLVNRSLGVPGLVTTTVFGRAGHGFYAAGYVKARNAGGTDWEFAPHAFELTAGEIVPLNAGLDEERSFAPTAGRVTDAPGADGKLVLIGARYQWGALYVNYASYSASRWSVSSAPLAYAYTSNDVSAALATPPVWARHWNDIYVPIHFAHFVHGDGTQFESSPLHMGQSFAVPKTIFGADGVGSEMWLVGDGFALKGAVK